MMAGDVTPGEHSYFNRREPSRRSVIVSAVSDRPANGSRVSRYARVHAVPLVAHVRRVSGRASPHVSIHLEASGMGYFNIDLMA